jgi:hypothetical protein
MGVNTRMNPQLAEACAAFGLTAHRDGIIASSAVVPPPAASKCAAMRLSLGALCAPIRSTSVLVSSLAGRWARRAELRHIVVGSALDNPVGPGLAVQPIWLTGFDCTGAELNIETCNATLIHYDYSPSCSHHQDVILTCSHIPAGSPEYELELPDDSFRSDCMLRIMPEPECLSFEQIAAQNACRSVGYAIDMYAQYEILDALVDADNSTDCLPYTNTSLHLQCYPMWPREEATPLYRLEAEERPGRGRLAVQLPPSNQ